jgi:hypothetical protein
MADAPRSTLNDFRWPATICRERRWGVGTQLVGDEGSGPTVIQITAIGERNILARELSHNGKRATHHNETLWTLGCRDWQERTHA